MALNANKVPYSGGSNRAEQPTLEPGGYPGRLVQIIALGLQPQAAYQGQEKPPVYKINLTYELADEFCVDEDGEEQEDKPRWVSEIIPLYSLKSEKAKSTQRYYALDPKEVHEGDFAALAGAPGLINLVNNTKGDKTYTNVASLSSLRAKDAKNVPELVNEPVIFDLDEPDMEVFEKLPDFIKDIIKGNLNYAGSPLQQALEGKVSKPAEEDDAEESQEEAGPDEGDEEW